MSSPSEIRWLKLQKDKLPLPTKVNGRHGQWHCRYAEKPFWVYCEQKNIWKGKFCFSIVSELLVKMHCIVWLFPVCIHLIVFDRVNHWILINKLIVKKLYCTTIGLLLWYRDHHVMIKWGGSVSELFKVVNGMRQGSILSP